MATTAKKKSNAAKPAATSSEILGILPLQDAVLFPNTVIPLAVVIVSDCNGTCVVTEDRRFY